ILDVIARLYGYAGSLFNILEKNSINSLCLCASVAKFLFLHSPLPCCKTAAALFVPIQTNRLLSEIYCICWQ
ncbi:MAG: hypothetical protein KBF93_23505, partial [Leptospiraceae bacterium]|nr:hypothetical protein [Leptospiraceae bacterium]